MLGARITTVAGASAWFVGGFQVYSAAMKTRLLGVEAELIAQHGVVSEAVARAMAERARERTGADWALAVTGEAGPESSSGVAPGTVWIGLAGAYGAGAHLVRVPGDRERVREFAVQSALNLLRLRLIAIS
jgi:PncC family amidohydrolase